MSEKPDVVTRAADALGSYANLARLCGVERGVVHQWKLSGLVPLKHCKTVEAATGITCIELRPDDWRMYWPELAEQAQSL